MKTFLLYIAVFFTLTVNSQNKKVVGNLQGLYFGGESYGESVNAIGYYFFNPDSSFIFIRTGFNHKKTKDFKDRFNDTLVGYGKGRWFLRDSLIITKFEPLPDENILQGELKYNTFSEAPYDSLFLKVNLTNYDEVSRNIALITLGNKMIGNPAGESGYREIALPLYYNQNKLLIRKIGYKEQAILLQPGYNKHEITITLSPMDSSMIDLVAGVEFPSKFNYQNEELKFDSRFKKQSEGKEKLALFIKNSFAKFPLQKAFLQKIINELN